MSRSNYPSAPQGFSFSRRNLFGELVAFSGHNPRRQVMHELLKLRGGRVEDMTPGPRRVEVRLVWTGPTCASDYDDFKTFIVANPTGLLVHPIAGKFQAFCSGPDEDVDFSRAVDEISARCSFVENNIDSAAPPADTPSPPAAAQSVTTQLVAFDQGTATLMGAIATAKLKIGRAMAAVQKAVATVQTVDDAIGTVNLAVTSAIGATSSAIGAVLSVQTQAEILEQNVADFIAQASDIFDGSDPIAGATGAINNLLGQVESQAQVVEDAMIAASSTPAGAADGIGSTEDLLASCYVLSDALAQAYPPVVPYTVPRTIGVVPLCVLLYPTKDPRTQASIVLTLNQIPNPVAISPGTVLQVPSK